MHQRQLRVSRLPGRVRPDPPMDQRSLEIYKLFLEYVIEHLKHDLHILFQISSGSVEKDDDPEPGMTGNILEMISKSLLGNAFKVIHLTPLLTSHALATRRVLFIQRNGHPAHSVYFACALDTFIASVR